MPNCGVCGKPYEISLRTWKDVQTLEWKCLHDDSSIGINKLETARKANREQTIMARRQASEALAQENAINPEITLAPPSDKSPTPFGSVPLKVRKNVLDSLASKSPIK